MQEAIALANLSGVSWKSFWESSSLSLCSLLSFCLSFVFELELEDAALLWSSFSPLGLIFVDFSPPWELDKDEFGRVLIVLLSTDFLTETSFCWWMTTCYGIGGEPLTRTFPVGDALKSISALAAKDTSASLTSFSKALTSSLGRISLLFSSRQALDSLLMTSLGMTVCQSPTTEL